MHTSTIYMLKTVRIWKVRYFQRYPRASYMWTCDIISGFTRQKIDHHHVPCHFVRRYKNMATRQQRQHGNVFYKQKVFPFTTSNIRDSNFHKNSWWNGPILFGGVDLVQKHSLCWDEMPRSKRTSKNLVNAASKNQLLQTLDTSSCIAKLEVLLAEGAMILWMFMFSMALSFSSST